MFYNNKIWIGDSNGEKVCISFFEKIRKAFVKAGAEAVYVPGYKFHLFSSYLEKFLKL